MPSFQPRSRSVLLLAATVASGPACAAPRPADPPQRSTSNYSDGTGDSAIDSLNATQLDDNYRGPRYQVRSGTNQPLAGPVPPFAAPYPSAVRPAAPVAPPPPAVVPSPVYPAGAPGS